MSPEDRKALGGIVVGVAWGGLTMAGPLAFPHAPQWIWQASFSLAVIIVLAGFAVLAYDFFVRPKGKRLDPFLGTAIIALVVALVSLAIYAVRGPPQVAGSEETSTAKPAQPEIALIPPDTRHEVIWNPKKQGLMIFSGPEGKVSNNSSWTPVFRVKTVNNTYVQDASIRWQIELTGIASLLKESKNLEGYTIDTSHGGVTIMGGPDHLMPFTYRDQDLSSSQSIPIPNITNAGAEAFIPNNVYNNAAFYILALLPDKPSARLDPFTFSATVSWNIPTPGSQKFLVKISIVNAKPPNVDEPKLDALISFEVAKIQ
jgi:hypothetical protein